MERRHCLQQELKSWLQIQQRIIHIQTGSLKLCALLHTLPLNVEKKTLTLTATQSEIQNYNITEATMLYLKAEDAKILTNYTWVGKI